MNVAIIMNARTTLATAEKTSPSQVPSPTAASERTVRGVVVAVNVKDSPPVIVLKAMTPNNEELIVGARVDSRTVITRGKDRVTLGAIKVGEQAAMTYLKSPDGLLARSIHVR